MYTHKQLESQWRQLMWVVRTNLSNLFFVCWYHNEEPKGEPYQYVPIAEPVAYHNTDEYTWPLQNPVTEFTNYMN